MTRADLALQGVRVDDGHHHVDPSGDWSAKIDAPAIQSGLRDVLASALHELPATHRAVIVLHDVEGLSMAEVADAHYQRRPGATSEALLAQRMEARNALAAIRSAVPNPSVKRR
jgi:predicted RNA polymerase sigma factor